MNSDEYLVVMTTVDSVAGAEGLATTLVERRLAACVQITGPVSSTYRWEGEITRSQEWLCLIKTRRASYEALEAAIRELHSYQTPEIVAVPIVAGSAEYLKWIDEETRNP
ncbi:MAG TPA: divalent-cation tolerance protein CutA [Pirellulales bacterium]|jgi:periplasmic divalent cation tolerance protein|nr:divalent-cation tolerance protein CutA [Pirellulales bacterium]